MAMTPQRLRIKSNHFGLWDVQLDTDWEDVCCPICLDSPHNVVLLYCSSYEKGCRPFMCDTGLVHSNCFDRFRSAHGIPSAVRSFPSSPAALPACPLCRGDVNGWVVVDEARARLNMKRRCCEERHCGFVGNFAELQSHAKMKHPDSRPSKIDSARRLDWENFQQSEEIVDVLSTIHAQVPNGVVMGDYVVEYGDDEFEDFRRSRRVRCWASCVLYKMFSKFRVSRSRARERRGGSRRSRSEASSLDEGSGSTDNSDYR